MLSRRLLPFSEAEISQYNSIVFAQVEFVKGEVSHKFAVISKPKNVCLSGRNKEIIVKFVINYHPSAIKLSISASGQRQSRSVWIET